MKTTITVFLTTLFLLTNIDVFGQLKTLSDGKQIDVALVGTWVGSEKGNQIEGMKKEWEMTRNGDGTFVLDFKFTQDGFTQNTIETGNWWIENGKFYEYHKESNLTDTYEYSIKNKNKIKFKSVNISIEMNTDAYEFTDTRKKENKNSNNKKDGLSIENAIKVNSVADEYKYIKEHCENCEIKSQALSLKNNRPYDVITVKKSDGTLLNYYFDIKSFFGKNF